MTINKNIKIILNYFLGPLVFLFLFYSIYRQGQKEEDWEESWAQIKSAITGPQQWKLWFTFLLMFVNWGLEARKWQLSIQQLEKVSFLRAFKATLSGVAIASFTPNRIGEYLGRMLYIDEGKRLRSISLTIVCSMAQLLVTLLVGIFGVIYLKKYIEAQPISDKQTFQTGLSLVLSCVSFIVVCVAFFYFRISSMVRLLERLKWKKILEQVKVLDDVKLTILFRILSLSFARYVVFILQYHLLFSLFDVSLNWGETFAGVSSMFLIMAIIPSFTFLTDLGIRWETGIQVIHIFNPNEPGILAASLGVWVINLVIPALIGSLLILRVKLFRSS
ncbi:MAG: flippase-like domain-containing protein [Bacteroidetes bacterium]|nr:flippase-like domain-containing protein [Bacteroidota bacterium]